MIQLNPTGKLARFYRFGSNSKGNLPDDFCTFFWGIVFNIILIMILGLMVFGAVFWIAIFFIWLGRIASHHRLISASVIAGGGIISLLIWRRRSLKFEVVKEVRDVFSTKVDAVKNRYCPRISWIEK